MTNIVSNQLDLFVSHLVEFPNKNENSLMEFPFFGITKKPDVKNRKFQSRDWSIDIRPDRLFGIPTIWDKDILIYCFNLLRHNYELGLPVSRTVQFPVYNYLKSTGRKTGSSQYKSFLDGIKRLKTTNIITNIRTNGLEVESGFSWISGYKAVTVNNVRNEEIVCAVQVELSEWIYRAATDKKRSLSISKDYFNLTMGLERRFYELARKHCGNQGVWECFLTTLYEKSGSQDKLKSFTYQIRKIIERENIPDYKLELEIPENVPQRHKLKLAKVRFFPKTGAYARGETKTPPAMPLFEAAEALPQKLPAALSIPTQPPESIYQEARATFRGYDVNYLWERWRGWAISQGQPIKSQKAAFMGFCKQHAGKNPL